MGKRGVKETHPAVRMMTKFVPHPTEMFNGHPCWQWVRAMDGHGYGVIGDRRQKCRMSKAYKIAYERFREPVPDGLQIDHLCRNRWCINPSHMEVVTQVENIRRGNSLSARRRRMTHCLNGHPLDGENLMVEGDHRRCRICRSAQRRRWWANRPGRAAP